MKKDDLKVFTENRKAYHDYTIIDKFEAGIVLSGFEVKMVRVGHINLNGSYVAILKGEAWLIKSTSNGRVSGWDKATSNSDKNRKLLLHRKEINEMKMQTEAKGLTAVPLKVYEKNGRIKILVGICRGKNNIDKREYLKNKELEHSIARRI